MLGYPFQSKGYNIWDNQSQKIIIARDVQFLKQQKLETNFDSEEQDVSADLSAQEGEVKVEVDRKIDNENSSNDDDSNQDVQDSSEDRSDSELEDASDSRTPVLRRSTWLRKNQRNRGVTKRTWRMLLLLKLLLHHTGLQQHQTTSPFGSLALITNTPYYWNVRRGSL